MQSPSEEWARRFGSLVARLGPIPGLPLEVYMHDDTKADAPACDVYERRWHVARKPHRCQCCGYRIPSGAQYERHHWVDGGTAADEACCWACAAGLWLLMSAYGSHPSPRWAMEFLHEEVVRETRERGALERDVLAGMLRRNRAALRERR